MKKITKLKSIIHFVMAFSIFMTSLNVGVFGTLVTYANTVTSINESEQLIKPFDELFLEENIHLVSSDINSALAQNIRQRMQELQQKNSEDDPSPSEVSEEEPEMIPVSEASEEKSEETPVPEASEEKSEVTPVPEASEEKSEVTPVPEVSEEKSEVTPVPEAPEEKSEVTSVPEVSEEKPEVIPVPEASEQKPEVNPVPEATEEKPKIKRFKNAKSSAAILVGSTYYDELSDAWANVQGQSVSGKEVTIKFVKDYTITSKDVKKIEEAFKAKRIIITAEPGVTVTINQNLEFWIDYTSDLNTRYSTITFENIKLKFPDEHKIIANGIWLHMGQGVEMLGNKFPKIQLGSTSRSINRNPLADIKLFIESGNYSEVIAESENDGKDIHKESFTYLFGGTIQKLSYGRNETAKKEHTIYIMGGNLVSAEDYEQGTGKYSCLKVIVATNEKKVLTNLINISKLELGYYDPVLDENISGNLEITGNITFKKDNSTGIGMYEGSSFTIGESVPSLTLESGWIGEHCTFILPANRDIQNIPLKFKNRFHISDNTKISVSNKITKDEFYLIEVQDNPIDVTAWIVDDNEEFYLESFENVGNNYYFKAKRKVTKLEYDFASNKMSYQDYNGTMHDAWWIEEKLSDNSIDISNLSYENISKPKKAHYSILSPKTFTLTLTGTASDKTFKINNERHTDRILNIEFKNLNLTNSELKFQNINSINIRGDNKIYQDSSFTQPALTYSLVNGNSITWVNDGRFSVYNRRGGDYEFSNQIIDEKNNGNVSISNLVFESIPTADAEYQFYSLDGSGSTKKFTVKSNYRKVSVLLPSDSNNYILCSASKAICQQEDAYYYQTSAYLYGANENSGPIGTRFTFSGNLTKNYYKINNTPRVFVKATNSVRSHYYISNTLKEAMEKYLSHTGGTHEVFFLGNYNINKDDDVNALEKYTSTTKGITFKTQIDDVKYVLNVSKDLILEKYAASRNYPVKFDNIRWQFNSDDIKIYANGRSLTFASDISTVGSHFPTIMGGHPKNHLLSKANITIQGGTYKSVIGHHDNITSGSSVTLNISNGIFNDDIIGSNVPNGTVDMSISNGTFRGNVIGATDQASGAVTMMINGGTFNEFVYGSKKGSPSTVSLTINGGTFSKNVYGETEGPSNSTTSVTVKIYDGTFNNPVIGANTANQVTFEIAGGTFAQAIAGTMESSNVMMKITGGTFNEIVYGSRKGSPSSTVSLTIDGGTFNKVVYGSREGSPSTVTLTIKGGTFAENVYGETESSNPSTASVTVKIQNGIFNGPVIGANTANQVKFEIAGGTFKEVVYGSRGGNPSTVTLTITGGTFAKQVYGEAEGSNNSRAIVTVKIQNGIFNGPVIGANTANQVTLEITGGTFAQAIAGSMGNSNVTMTITGGTFNDIVYGGRNDSPSTVTLTITGGTFATQVIGTDSTNAAKTVNIKINGQISIPTIKGYDLLSIGEDTKSMLTIGNQITSTDVHDEKVKLQNQSTLRLQGQSSSTIKDLEIQGANNTLVLAMNSSKAPLMVKNSYSFNNQKLNLTALGNKSDASTLIDFPKHKADIQHFNFTDADYYMREITSGNGHDLVLYQKMDPSKTKLKWDLANNSLKYSIDGNNESDVWWYSINFNNNNNIALNEDNLMKYKGTEIFKKNTPSGITLEISNSTSNKNISIDSTTAAPWNLKLNAVSLTDSTLNATNLKQLEIEGQNIITSLSSPSPVFTYSFSGNGEVIATNNQSNLVVYSTNQGGISVTNPQSGNIGKVLSLSFEQVTTQDEQVRLVDDKNNKISYTIPQNTEKMSLLFGSNVSSSYHLYHGLNSTTGSSIYVAGVTNDTFTDSFNLNSNNQIAEYRNVRRANPVRNINIKVDTDISFKLDLGSSNMSDVNRNNWSQYFSANPLEVEVLDGTRAALDVYTDSNGKTHYFAERPLTIKTTYEGIELNGTSADLELVASSNLDPNLTLQTKGAKMALLLVDNEYRKVAIPLIQDMIINSMIWWKLEHNKPLVLDIVPNLYTNDYFFNADLVTEKYQTNHHLKFKFEVIDY